MRLVFMAAGHRICANRKRRSDYRRHPTVYTRQRLVNDRLAQAAWLNDQLLITKTKDPNPTFRSIDQVRVRTVSDANKLGFAFGADGGSSRDQSPTSDGSTAQKQEGKEAAIPTVDPTTSDLFRAKPPRRSSRGEMETN